MTTGNGNGGYVHGTHAAEQSRLAKLNALTNPAFLAFLSAEGLGSEGAPTVLEVGAGLGILATEVGRLVPRGSVLGVELDEAQLARGRLLLGEDRPSNVELVSGDAQQLPFGRDTFDLVYCRYLLEHVPNPARALSEMRRVLKPGGRVCVQENDVSLVRFDPPTPSWDLVWSRFVELQAALGGDALIGRKLFGLLRRAGFVDVALSIVPECHWSGSTGFAPWVENLIGNVEGAAAQLLARGLVTERQLGDALGELHAVVSREDASTSFHWNRAVGRKA